MSTLEESQSDPEDERARHAVGPPVLDEDVLGADGADQPADPERSPGPARPAPASPTASPADADLVTVDPRTARRAPRYGRFALAGVLVGAAVALVLALIGAPDESLGRGVMFLLLAAVLAPLGALIACLGAVLGERRRPPPTAS